MSDQMLFPETWGEFEKQYGFYDSKQAYMYGNTRLIPSFRVEQWLDHIADIKRKEQSQANKMQQVAKLFGKKLGEEFWIQGFCGVYRVKFTEGGILYLDTDEPNNYRWRLHNIDPLLTGNAEILSDDDWRVKQTIKDLSNMVVIVNE